ncbi:hypothetical protein [Pseudomonas sp. TE3610]
MTTLTQAVRRLILTQEHTTHLSRHGGIPATLPAPVIPQLAVHDGLNWNDLRDPQIPVVVQVVLQPDMYPGDTLNLFWNDTVVGSQPISADDIDVGQTVFKVMPREIPTGGLAHVHYHHIGLLGADERSSFEVPPFLVKITVPGNPDPDPSTPYVNENLPAPTGIPSMIDASNARDISVGIARYPNIAEHDVITLYWSSVPVPHVVTAAEANTPGMALNITVTADVISRNPGLGLTVTYDIRDTVKNWSLFSLSAHTDVEAPGSLHAPSVREADDFDVLDVDALDGADVSIWVPVNGNLVVGDQGVLTWTGQPVLGPRVTFTLPFEILQAATRLTLYVPNAQAAALVGSTASVYYDVNGRRSARATVSVVGQPATLAAPRLTGVDGPQYNPDAIVGATQEVIVPAYAFMAVGQTVKLVWDGVTATGGSIYEMFTRSIQAPSQVGVPISFQVPKNLATALAGGSLNVSYKIAADGQEYASPQLSLSVTGQVNTLPAPETLPVFANGQVDPDQLGSTLQVVVKANGLLQPGDQVTVHWHGRPDASTNPVSSFPSSGDLAVTIAKDPFVLGNTHFGVDVWYDVRRNGAIFGSSRVLALSIGEAGQLPWPQAYVSDATGSLANPWSPIKPGTVREENTATVEISDVRLQVQDSVVVVWKRSDGTTTNIPASVTISHARAIVPRALLALSLNQQVELGYVVSRGGAVIGAGQALILPLQALPATALSLLVIQEATNSGAGTDAMVSAMAAATVRIGVWPFIDVTHKVWLQISGTYADGSPYFRDHWPNGGSANQGWIDQGSYTTELPIADIKRLKDGTALTLTFKANLHGERDEAKAITFATRSYTVKPLVDTSTLVLSGLAVRAQENWPRTGEDFIGNWNLRTGKNGTAPYTYASSNAAVASVSVEGKVVGLKNGTAVITVTDRVGVSAQYSVVVNNVWTFLVHMDPLDQPGSVAWMLSHGGTRVINQELEVLYRYYQRPLPGIGTVRAWIGHTPGGCGSPLSTVVVYENGYIGTCHSNGSQLAAVCIRAT